jgi:hypothetical protein
MIRIAPEANNIFINGSKESLATGLGKALKGFEFGKAFTAVGSNPASVVQCKAVIAEAYAHGVIIDTDFEKLQQQLNEKDAEIARLREQNKKPPIIIQETDLTELNEKDKEIAELNEKLQKVSTDLVYWRGRHDELDIRLKGMFRHREGDEISGV